MKPKRSLWKTAVLSIFSNGWYLPRFNQLHLLKAKGFTRLVRFFQNWAPHQSVWWAGSIHRGTTVDELKYAVVLVTGKLFVNLALLVITMQKSSAGCLVFNTEDRYLDLSVISAKHQKYQTYSCLMCNVMEARQVFLIVNMMMAVFLVHRKTVAMITTLESNVTLTEVWSQFWSTTQSISLLWLGLKSKLM